MRTNANSRRIHDLLYSHSGHIYVCGDANLANEVKSAVVSIFQEQENIDLDEAASVVDNLFVSFLPVCLFIATLFSIPGH